MSTPFYVINTNNADLNRVQAHARVALDPLTRDLLANRIELSASVTTSNTTIQHALGRVPSGWIIIDKDADARVWRISLNRDTIVLKASAAVNIKLFLF
jgi:hypothetical protein